MAENNKKYLDQGGLAKVFELIAGKYATSTALQELSAKIGEWDADDLNTIAEALAQAQEDITKNSGKIKANETSIKELQSTLAALGGDDSGLSFEEIAELLGQLNDLNLEDLAKKLEVDATYAKKGDSYTKAESDGKYATKEELNTQIGNVVSKEDYESDKETFATKTDIADMATKTWVGNEGFLKQSDLNGYATESWVEEQEYLTEDDLKDYAKTADVVSKETYESDKETFATKTDVEEAIEELGIDEYLKSEEADEKFVSKSELEEEIGKLDLSNTYLTKTEASTTYETIENVAAKADKTEAIGSVEYNKEGKKIVFTAVDGETELGEVDCTDFIKDGMVENVEIKDGKLVITFNTDSGKEDAIELELTDIFNADNYYNKTDADAKFLSIETYNSLALSDAEITAAFNGTGSGE